MTSAPGMISTLAVRQWLETVSDDDLMRMTPEQALLATGHRIGACTREWLLPDRSAIMPTFLPGRHIALLGDPDTQDPTVIHWVAALFDWPEEPRARRDALVAGLGRRRWLDTGDLGEVMLSLGRMFERDLPEIERSVRSDRFKFLLTSGGPLLLEFLDRYPEDPASMLLALSYPQVLKVLRAWAAGAALTV